jgi:hypothetical protein
LRRDKKGLPSSNHKGDRCRRGVQKNVRKKPWGHVPCTSVMKSWCWTSEWPSRPNCISILYEPGPSTAGYQICKSQSAGAPDVLQPDQWGRGPVRTQRQGSNPDVPPWGPHAASAECRHWSGRAVRWSSGAILRSARRAVKGEPTAGCRRLLGPDTHRLVRPRVMIDVEIAWEQRSSPCLKD